ncbi:hypothetical protein QJQ45_018265, partial [Haematococcus lacustris]
CHTLLTRIKLMRSSAQLLCVIVGLLGVAGHLVPSGTSATHQPSVALGGVAIPVSDWYFVIRLSLGWLTRKSPYCGIDPDPSSFELLLTCNRKSVPYASLFTFVTAPEAVGPVVTGQPLMLLSRTSGLCDDGALSRSVGTAGSPPPGTLLQGGPAAAGQRGRSSYRQQASQAVGLRLGAASGEGGAGAEGGWVPMREPGALTGITCKQSHSQLPSSFSLWNSLLLPGLPLNLTAGGDSLYMMQGERYCGVRTVGPHDVVVCDLPSSSGAARFNFQPTGFPFAGLDAFATQQPCGARSLLAPPPHDVQCANTPGRGEQQGAGQRAGRVRVGQGAAGTQPEQRMVQHVADSGSSRGRGSGSSSVTKGESSSSSSSNSSSNSSSSSSGGNHAESRGATAGGGVVAVAGEAGGHEGRLAGSSPVGPRSGGQGAMAGLHHQRRLALQQPQEGQAPVSLWWWQHRDGQGGMGQDQGQGANSGQQEQQQQQQQRVGTVASMAVAEEVEEDSRYYCLTLLLQTPGSHLVSGITVGFVTYSEGLVGFPLQQCCPLPDSPHVIDCGVAQSDPMPAECWFNLMKVDAKSGTPLEDGDLIMLQSKAFGRYCSISVDGTLLCVSASPSNASRNLFTLRLSRGRLQFPL